MILLIAKIRCAHPGYDIIKQRMTYTDLATLLMFGLVLRRSSYILRTPSADMRQFRVDPSNRTLNCSRDIDVEKRSVLSVHGRNLASGESLVPSAVNLILCFGIAKLRRRCIEWRIAIDRVPMLASCEAFTVDVAEAGCCQGTLGPAAADGCKMPFYALGCSVAVELCTYIDKSLNGCDVDVVDSTEVENNGTKNGSVVVGVGLLSAPWTWVVPWAVTNLGITIQCGRASNGVRVRPCSPVG
jgi:hypothetical protein